MATVYLVTGTTGEWSDEREWLIVAYSEKGLAERHVYLATRATAVARKKTSSEINPYDPDNGWLSGATYSVREVELREAVPEPGELLG